MWNLLHSETLNYTGVGLKSLSSLRRNSVAYLPGVSVIRDKWFLTSKQKCTENLQIGVDADTNFKMGESTCSLGYQVPMLKKLFLWYQWSWCKIIICVAVLSIVDLICKLGFIITVVDDLSYKNMTVQRGGIHKFLRQLDSKDHNTSSIRHPIQNIFTRSSVDMALVAFSLIHLTFKQQLYEFLRNLVIMNPEN